MSAFPGSPRLLKDAILGVDPLNPLASVVLFQYNPDTRTRPLQPQTLGNAKGERSDLLRLTGAPVEPIKLDAGIDLTDQFGFPEQHNAPQLGLHPQLAALETLGYPTNEQAHPISAGVPASNPQPTTSCYAKSILNPTP